MTSRASQELRLKRDESGKSNLFNDQSYFNCVVSAHLFLFVCLVITELDSNKYLNKANKENKQTAWWSP